MVIKVAVPHQFKLKVIPDLKTLFFVDRKDIHYIGGSDIQPVQERLFSSVRRHWQDSDFLLQYVGSAAAGLPFHH